MTVEINGQTESLPDAQPLTALLDERQPRPPFAVEINKRLVRRGEYANVRLQDGDRVEIVTLVGGG